MGNPMNRDRRAMIVLLTIVGAALLWFVLTTTGTSPEERNGCEAAVIETCDSTDVKDCSDNVASAGHKGKKKSTRGKSQKANSSKSSKPSKDHSLSSPLEKPAQRNE